MISVLRNAHIITLDTAQPIAQAVAILNGKFIAVGRNDQISAEFDGKALFQDMGGKTILPGLTDAHIHLHQYALSLEMVDCETSTRAECLRRVAERARSLSPGTWIRGYGWNQNLWPEGYGSAADIDRVAPNHPIFLTVKSLHAAWVNSAALQICGINADTTDPMGGLIQRDSSNQPTGILFETAMDLVQSKIPEPTPHQLAEMLIHAQSTLIQYGLTGVHDFDQSLCFSALQIMQQQHSLHLRVVKSIPMENLDEAAALGLRSGFGNDHLRIGSIKLFADGALGPKTAAMIQPYEGDPENTGILMLDGETLFEYGQKAVSSGLNLTVHAIGDRANHEVLNGFEHLRQFEQDHNLSGLRHRIEHVQILHPEDFTRLSKNHIIASMQPSHATSDMIMADKLWGKRSVGAYAWRTLLHEGTMLVFGSDAPVESPNPFLGLHAAVTRQRADGSPSPDGWYPDQRLSLREALSGFTTAPAFAAGWENKIGKIAPGYFADLLVLEQDPFVISSKELAQTLPTATMISGEWVWLEKPTT